MFDSVCRAGSVGKKLNVHIGRCYCRRGHGRVIAHIHARSPSSPQFHVVPLHPTIKLPNNQASFSKKDSGSNFHSCFPITSSLCFVASLLNAVLCTYVSIISSFLKTAIIATTTNRSAMAARTAREYRVSTAEVPKYEYDEDNET